MELLEGNPENRNLEAPLLESTIICVPHVGRHWSMRLFMTPGTAVTRLPCPLGSRGKNTGVGCHSLLQGIFPTQRIESMSPVLQLQADSLRLSHQGSPGPPGTSPSPFPSTQDRTGTPSDAYGPPLWTCWS